MWNTWHEYLTTMEKASAGARAALAEHVKRLPQTSFSYIGVEGDRQKILAEMQKAIQALQNMEMLSIRLRP